MITPKPYSEKREQQCGTGVTYIYRTFSADVEADELVWHRDRESRQVHILSGHGWKFQKDDRLPEEIKPGTDLYIHKGIYHRLIKGETDLVIRIKEI